MPSEPEAPGLRERKKTATRAALSETALRLALERGLSQVRVEEIAAGAGVSPRTFNNYFSSKEEAVVSLLAGRVRRFREAIARHAGEEPLWDVIGEAALALVPTASETHQWRQWVGLIMGTPSLEAVYLRANASLERDLALDIADRTGTDPQSDLFPRLAACATVAAIRAALQFWLDNQESASYSALLQRAIAEVAAGLPAPPGK